MFNIFYDETMVGDEGVPPVSVFSVCDDQPSFGHPSRLLATYLRNKLAGYRTNQRDPLAVHRDFAEDLYEQHSSQDLLQSDYIWRVLDNPQCSQ